ncbi:hypothetical protein QEN19_003755 [Hanseniaspora menglaensis]
MNSENVKVELYTTFIKTYIVALVPLSIYGTWLLNDQFSIWYTIYLLIWGLLFKNYWVHYKSKKIEGKNKLIAVSTVQPRSIFIKKITLIPVILSILLVGQLTTFSLEILITQLVVIENNYLKIVLSLIPTILTTVLVQIITIIFNKAIDTKSSYILTIWTSYVPLLITLFVYLPFGYKLNHNNNLANIFTKVQSYDSKWTTITTDYKINQLRFMDQFKFFIITNQLVALALDNVLPKILNRDIKFVAPIDIKLGYLKYLLNFGFLVIFSNTWSLAPLISLVFVTINFYIDSYKIKKGKYIVNDDLNVGNILKIFNWMASVVQPALILMYKHTPLPDVGISATDKFWFSKSPLSVDVSFVLAGAFIVEHFNIGLDRVFAKITFQKLEKELRAELKKNEREEIVSNKKTIGNSTGFQESDVREDVVGSGPDLKNKIKNQAGLVLNSNSEVPSSLNLHASNLVENTVTEKLPASTKGTVEPQNALDNMTKQSDDFSAISDDDDLSVGATLPRIIPTSANYDSRNGLEQKHVISEPKQFIPETPDINILPKVDLESLKTEKSSPHVQKSHEPKSTFKNVPKHSLSDIPAHVKGLKTHVVKDGLLSSQAATASLIKGSKEIEKDLGLTAINPKKSAETIFSNKSKSKGPHKKKKKIFGLKI